MFVACIDIGGTFTDLVLHSRGGGLEIFKSPTTPGEFERGFIDAFRARRRSPWPDAWRVSSPRPI